MPPPHTQHHNSSILFANASHTVFLLDIPHSIAQAQHLHLPNSSSSCPCPRKLLIPHSTLPLLKPYPSTEPKSAGALQKVRQGFSAKELELHEEYVRSVGEALKEVGAGMKGREDWCEERFGGEVLGVARAETIGGKRKRKRADGGGHGIELEQDVLNGEVGREIDFRSSSIKTHYNPADEAETFVFEDVILDARDELGPCTARGNPADMKYTIPPQSAFLLHPLPDPKAFTELASTISSTCETKYSFILLDPPWPNRSAARRASYVTHDPRNLDDLKDMVLESGLNAHLNEAGYVAVWVTNKASCREVVTGGGGLFEHWGIEAVEEWIWVKVTKHGEPVTELAGLWRRPYEMCLIGRKCTVEERETVSRSTERGEERGKGGDVVRRVIVGVPDLHSRKPCLKGLVELVLLEPEQRKKPLWGVEVFARYCVSEWVAWGDEAVIFNRSDGWDEA